MARRGDVIPLSGYGSTADANTGEHVSWTCTASPIPCVANSWYQHGARAFPHKIRAVAYKNFNCNRATLASMDASSSVAEQFARRLPHSCACSALGLAG